MMIDMYAPFLVFITKWPTFLCQEFQMLFKRNWRIFITISLKCVHYGPINNTSVLVQVLSWRRKGDSPLPKPMITWFTNAYIYIHLYASPVLNMLLVFKHMDTHRKCRCYNIYMYNIITRHRQNQRHQYACVSTTWESLVPLLAIMYALVAVLSFVVVVAEVE